MHHLYAHCTHALRKQALLSAMWAHDPEQRPSAHEVAVRHVTLLVCSCYVSLLFRLVSLALKRSRILGLDRFRFVFVRCAAHALLLCLCLGPVCVFAIISSVSYVFALRVRACIIFRFHTALFFVRLTFHSSSFIRPQKISDYVSIKNQSIKKNKRPSFQLAASRTSPKTSP